MKNFLNFGTAFCATAFAAVAAFTTPAATVDMSGSVSQNTVVQLNYTEAGVSKLCERYADNYFMTEPKRKYSLWAVPPGPHLER